MGCQAVKGKSLNVRKCRALGAGASLSEFDVDNLYGDQAVVGVLNNIMQTSQFGAAVSCKVCIPCQHSPPRPARLQTVRVLHKCLALG